MGIEEIGIEVDWAHDSAVLKLTESFFLNTGFQFILVRQADELCKSHVLELFEATFFNERCVSLFNLAPSNLLVHLGLLDLVKLLDLKL